MITRKEYTDGLYGFGAVAHVTNTAQTRRNKHALSLFAAALSTLIATLLFALLPISTAAAHPLVGVVGTSADTVGLAAMAAFSISTGACALMAVALLSGSRNSRRRHARLRCLRRAG